MYTCTHRDSVLCTKPKQTKGRRNTTMKKEHGLTVLAYCIKLC